MSWPGYSPRRRACASCCSAAELLPARRLLGLLLRLRAVGGRSARRCCSRLLLLRSHVPSRRIAIASPPTLRACTAPRLLPLELVDRLRHFKNDVRGTTTRSLVAGSTRTSTSGRGSGTTARTTARCPQPPESRCDRHLTATTRARKPQSAAENSFVSLTESLRHPLARGCPSRYDHVGQELTNPFRIW
jgi:hypothetical protein